MGRAGGLYWTADSDVDGEETRTLVELPELGVGLDSFLVTRLVCLLDPTTIAKGVTERRLLVGELPVAALHPTPCRVDAVL